MSEHSISRHPSDYERQAIREIRDWEKPDESLLGVVRRHVYDAYNFTADQVRKIPGVDWTIENVIAGLIRLINEITLDWVPSESILKKYEQGDQTVDGLADIRGLDLEIVDRAAADVAVTYRNLAGAEGAATGFAGAAGIPTDVVALVALNLRAAGEYATYYGFDISSDFERLYALTLLDHVAQPSTKAKDVAMSPVVKLTSRLARMQAFEVIEQIAMSKAVSRIVRSIGIHLTRAKLAQLIPVTGAVIGGGYNAYYTSKVCNTAYHSYRRRFLINKYGSHVVDGVAEKAESP
ncbi:MAG: EcsC family protein [Rhodothermales bacterium]|nr:EcsC family protein [Rhodothermales bacterium]